MTLLQKLAKKTLCKFKGCNEKEVGSETIQCPAGTVLSKFKHTECTRCGTWYQVPVEVVC